MTKDAMITDTSSTESVGSGSAVSLETGTATTSGSTRKPSKPRVPKLPLAEHHDHRGEAVQVGPYTILLGGTQYLRAEDIKAADILMPLTALPLEFGKRYRTDDLPTLVPLARHLPPLDPGRTYDILAAPLKDFGGVPESWKDFLTNTVIPLLADGKLVLAFCIGSHGRTGTLLASLIALLEPKTTDPILAARQRHCVKSVETKAQATAVFALRGKSLPKRWQNAFHF